MEFFFENLKKFKIPSYICKQITEVITLSVF